MRKTSKLCELNSLSTSSCILIHLYRYTAVEESADAKGVPPPTSWEITDVEAWLANLAATIHSGAAIDPSQDMFDQGFDRHAPLLFSPLRQLTPTQPARNFPAQPHHRRVAHKSLVRCPTRCTTHPAILRLRPPHARRPRRRREHARPLRRAPRRRARAHRARRHRSHGRDIHARPPDGIRPSTRRRTAGAGRGVAHGLDRQRRLRRARRAARAPARAPRVHA